jgi:hypothetical protein
MPGIFDLISADDLCAKLEHDFARVQKSPSDVYAAFDFVITGWHLLEWRYPGDDEQSRRTALRDENPVIELCEHLAVQGKHYEPTSKRHRTVRLSRRDSMWKRGFWAPSVWAENSWKDELVIELSGSAEEAFGEKLSFLEFAELLMEFWRTSGDCPGHEVSGTAP